MIRAISGDGYGKLLIVYGNREFCQEVLDREGVINPIPFFERPFRFFAIVYISLSRQLGNQKSCTPATRRCTFCLNGGPEGRCICRPLCSFLRP